MSQLHACSMLADRLIDRHLTGMTGGSCCQVETLLLLFLRFTSIPENYIDLRFLIHQMIYHPRQIPGPNKTALATSRANCMYMAIRYSLQKAIYDQNILTIQEYFPGEVVHAGIHPLPRLSLVCSHREQCSEQ